MNRDDLRRLAEAVGLGEHAATVAQAAKDAVRITPVATEEHRQVLGGSRFGGLPDLAVDQEWPVWKRGPLGFVAQIELAALTPFLPSGLLPSTGWLSFFYNPEQDTWGFDPADAEGFRVIYTAGSASIRRMRAREALDDLGRFQACDLMFSQDLSLPSLDGDAFREAGLHRAPTEKLEDLMEALWGDHGWGSRSKLFGFADEIQNPMEEECALVAGGVYCGDGSALQDPRAGALTANARLWELLLQVSSHEEAQMMWGDMGMLYFWLRAEDRQAQHFEKSWLILQCS
jgi:uncharacterized protein YwqG